MRPTSIKALIPRHLETSISIPEQMVQEFLEMCGPAEREGVLYVTIDARTEALFTECHIPARHLVPLSTTDVPLDPEDQSDYRANRDIVADDAAFVTMKDDARNGRSFSNIVAEFTTEFEADHPLKIIGGQHRFQAIAEALEVGVDSLHGVKVYFGLTQEQRFDVQLISNTVIAVPADLLDRMQETMYGPELREWCQRTGLLGANEDFADKKRRGGRMTVRAARTFILNYFEGHSIAQNGDEFEKTDTCPILNKGGSRDIDWEGLRKDKKIWKDSKLEEAGREFALLTEAQRNAFGGKKGNADFQDKANNFAVLAAWAYTAGLLQVNPTRLKRHYELKNQKGKDPLNASVLANAKHHTDAENYRGLGYRTDGKERGRLVELFYLQAEEGNGINKTLVDLAMKTYHAKQAALEVVRAKNKSQ